MSDVNGTAKVPRERKAEYNYIDESGATVVDGDKVQIEQAVGVRYVPAAGGSVDWLIPDAIAGSIQTMLAVAGAKIELRNAGRGESEAEGTDQPATKRRDRMVDGDWGDLAGLGGGRAPIDDDRLVLAMQTVLTAKGKPFREDKVRAGFAAGGTIAGKSYPDSKAYKAACMKLDGIEAEYNRLGGKTTSVEDVADSDFA